MNERGDSTLRQHFNTWNKLLSVYSCNSQFPRPLASKNSGNPRGNDLKSGDISFASLRVYDFETTDFADQGKAHGSFSVCLRALCGLIFAAFAQSFQSGRRLTGWRQGQVAIASWKHTPRGASFRLPTVINQTMHELPPKLDWCPSSRFVALPSLPIKISRHLEGWSRVLFWAFLLRVFVLDVLFWASNIICGESTLTTSVLSHLKTGLTD